MVRGGQYVISPRTIIMAKKKGIIAFVPAITLTLPIAQPTKRTVPTGGVIT